MQYMVSTLQSALKEKSTDFEAAKKRLTKESTKVAAAFPAFSLYHLCRAARDRLGSLLMPNDPPLSIQQGRPDPPPPSPRPSQLSNHEKARSDMAKGLSEQKAKENKARRLLPRLSRGHTTQRQIITICVAFAILSSVWSSLSCPHHPAAACQCAHASSRTALCPSIASPSSS